MSRAEEDGGEAGAGLGPRSAKGEQDAGRGRRVHFLLPPVTIRGAPSQEEEEAAFHRRVRRLLGPARGGFERLFAADGWEDLLEEKSVRKLLVRGSRREGLRPQPNQEVTVKLLGVLEDQSLVERDPQLTFVPGQGDVPQALELGVLSMQLGEVALILTSPAYAYGHVGREPDVPEEAPLLYEVTLLRVQDGPDPALLPAAKRLSLGNQKRERGNFHFERGDYQPALHSYRQALRILASPGTGLQEEEGEEEEALRQLRVKCLNNCAATQLKLRLLEEALVSCNEAMRLDPDSAKALYWKGKLLAELGEEQAAREMLKRALRLAPATKAVHAELSRMAGQQKGQLGPGRDSPGEDSSATRQARPGQGGPAGASLPRQREPAWEPVAAEVCPRCVPPPLPPEGIASSSSSQPCCSATPELICGSSPESPLGTALWHACLAACGMEGIQLASFLEEEDKAAPGCPRWIRTVENQSGQEQLGGITPTTPRGGGIPSPPAPRSLAEPSTEPCAATTLYLPWLAGSSSS